MVMHGRKTILLATDYSGSVLSAADTTGSNAVAYTPYGDSPTGADPLSQLRFNGALRESMTGCYSLGNGYRMYSPVLMRFLRPDMESPFGKGWLNAYVYCGGDPRNRYDPDGHAFSSVVSRLNKIVMFEIPRPRLLSSSASKVSTPAAITLNKGSIIYDTVGSSSRRSSFSSGYESIKPYKGIDIAPTPKTPSALAPNQNPTSTIGTSHSRRKLNPMHQEIFGVTYSRDAHGAEKMSVSEWVVATHNIPDEELKAFGQIPRAGAIQTKNLDVRNRGIQRDRKLQFYAAIGTPNAKLPGWLKG